MGDLDLLLDLRERADELRDSQDPHQPEGAQHQEHSCAWDRGIRVHHSIQGRDLVILPFKQFQVVVFGIRALSLEFQVSVFGVRISRCRFQVSDSGIWNSGFGFRVSGFRFRVSGFRLRVSGIG